jgi:hypothetical protein
MTDTYPKSLLARAWERLKAFGREVDAYGAEKRPWIYQRRIEQRRIASDVLAKRLDPATGERLYQEAAQRRENAWRAFHPSDPEAE